MDSAGLLRKLAVEQRRKESAAVKEFVEAALSADGERFYNALITVDKEMPWVWSRCMRAMARVSCSDEFRRVFLQIYLQSGDHIRQKSVTTLRWLTASGVCCRFTMARLGLFTGVTALGTVAGERMGRRGQRRWTWH